MTTVKCALRCINNLHKPIPLPNGKDVLIGRGPETGITDKRCSRNQVTLCADTKEMQVKIMQMGSNVTGVNGMAIGKGRSQILRHNDRLEILLGQYIHKIEFDPPPEEANVNKRAIKPMDNIIASKKMRPDDDHCNPSMATENKWEDIDGGQLLIYTGKNVQGRSWYNSVPGSTTLMDGIAQGASTILKENVFAEIITAYEKVCAKNSWKHKDYLEKIAAFDLDGTIITTKSGRVFPKDIDDWKIAFPEVPGKLKQLWNEGYKIVILSNQAGIARGNVKSDDFKSKVIKIISVLGVPIQAFVSTGKAIYRKPAPGMWNVLVEKKNDGVSVDMSKSFYCGDAAGRIENWAPKKKKDFSCSDRLFALNLNLQFYTPEEHFLKQKPGHYKLPNFNPSSLKSDNLPICDPENASLTSDNKEVIILVGCPGSGKSFIAKAFLVTKGYRHVNRDKLGSWQKCLSVMTAEIDKGHSVVIDNTNPDKESRKRFIEAATKHSVPIRCFVMTTSFEHCKHNNKFREFTDSAHEKITDMVMNSYKSKYEEPSLDEGFSSIVKINCIPRFDDPNLEKLYRMYLLEK